MSAKLPVLFISHGSPTVLLNDKSVTNEWKNKVNNISPDAILVVSAHWETTEITIGGNGLQKIIYDFYSFPKELYDYKYPVVSAEYLAARIAQQYEFLLDNSRGLDHGSWVPLMAMFPKANIPVMQMSVSPTMDFKEHFALGKRLAKLRQQNILIIASGATIHNLAALNWRVATGTPDDWAYDFFTVFNDAIYKHDVEKLCDPYNYFPNACKAIPTTEHYLPFLVALGAASDDGLKSFCNVWRFNNLSMHSYVFSKS